MIRKEIMNSGMEEMLFEDLNKLPYFARRHKLLSPFIMIWAYFCTLFGGGIDSESKESLEQYVPLEKRKNLIYMSKLVAKLVYYRFRYEFTFKEYFLLGFDKIDKKARLEYLAGFERLRVYGQVNTFENIKKFADKYKCYTYFENYFKRDIVIVNGSEDLIPFSMFVNNHDKFIFKPNDDSGGHGVMVVDKATAGFNMMTLFKSMLVTGPGIVEEFVQQDDKIGVFHANSVNTIRFTTYYNQEQNRFVKMYAMLRVGRGDAEVDNASAGGIVCAIDLDTGVVMSDGRCEDGVIYSEHPDTHMTFKGYQVPRWDELNDMLVDLVRVIPSHKIVGWDFALDKNKGWVLIEANSCPGMIAAQMCHGPVFREKFRNTLFNDVKYGKLYSNAKL